MITMVQTDSIMNEVEGSETEFPTNGRSTNPVNLYTTPRDARSAKTRAWLEARNIPFIDHNVVADPDALSHMIKVSGSRRVPVVQIGDRVFIGFDESQLATSMDGSNGIEKGRLEL
jgi:glutaredoxin